MQGMTQDRPLHIIGILLAAGSGKRFDPCGRQNKLLQVLPGGDGIGVAAARNLLSAVPAVLAAVKPGAEELARQLQEAGCTVAVCPRAEHGMGATLAFALDQAREANGWLIALADMPYVKPDTLRLLAQALREGADIAAPLYQGRRGNPVGFSRKHLAQLLELDGDRGARNLLNVHPVTDIPVDDAGVLRDIDAPGDLA